MLLEVSGVCSGDDVRVCFEDIEVCANSRVEFSCESFEDGV